MSDFKNIERDNQYNSLLHKLSSLDTGPKSPLNPKKKLAPQNSLHTLPNQNPRSRRKLRLVTSLFLYSYIIFQPVSSSSLVFAQRNCRRKSLSLPLSCAISYGGQGLRRGMVQLGPGAVHERFRVEHAMGEESKRERERHIATGRSFATHTYVRQWWWLLPLVLRVSRGSAANTWPMRD